MRRDRRDRTEAAGIVHTRGARPGAGLIDGAPDVEATNPQLLLVALVHGKRRDEGKARAGDAGVCRRKAHAAIGRLSQRITGELLEQYIVAGERVATGVDGDIAAVATGQCGPVEIAALPDLGPVVLQPAEVARTVRIGGAMVELGSDIARIAVHPGGTPGNRATAQLSQGGIDRCARVVGAVYTAIMRGEQHLVGRAVVARVKDQAMLVGVVVFTIHALGEPPIARRAPVHAAVVRAPEVNPTQPEPIGVQRVDRDHVVIPALVEQAGGAEAALAQQGDHGVGHQQLVDLVSGAREG